MSAITSLVLLLLTIGFVVFTTTRWKLHPFFALLLGACGHGLAAGLSPDQTLEAVGNGLGRTVAGIGIVIASGCVIGAVLERTGAALAMVNAVLRLVGRTRTVLAMGLTGGIVSVPVFCDSGFVILAPLARSLALRAKQSMAAMSVALSMGLYATHCLVPPTPGPVTAAGELHADLGRVIALGGFVALVVIVACWGYAITIGRRIYVEPPVARAIEPDNDRPVSASAWVQFGPILLPVALIALRSFAGAPESGNWAATMNWVGHPNMALLLGAMLALGLARREGADQLAEWTHDALRTAGSIVLITGAGGALGAVLRATPLADQIGELLGAVDLGRANLVLVFAVAALLKTAQGSSTVALITTASLVSPLLGALGLETQTELALTVLAIGAGSMTVSHVNDSYFWVVTQLSGLSVAQGYRLITVASAVAGLTAIIVIVALRFLLT